MKARLYIVLCIAFITQMAGVLPLQAGHYYYKQISLKEGLPSTVRCILTDEQGFVWIGTRSGLGRFDGHELKKYIHHADDPHSLPHDLVLQIAEDEQYNIWILTDKGVARYQRQSDDFYLPTDEKGKNITAYSTCPTPEGLLFGAKTKFTFTATGTVLSACCRNSTRHRISETSISRYSAFGMKKLYSVAAAGKGCSCST